MCLALERIAEHLDLVVSDVAGQLLIEETLHYLSLDSRTKLALDHAHGSLSHAEAGNIGLLTIILELLVYLFLIICLFKRNGQQSTYFFRGFK